MIYTKGEMNVDARVLYNRLMELRVGDVITYDDIFLLIKKDVRSDKHRHLLTSARKHAVGERYVFGTITKIGLKRLNDTEIINESGTGLASMRRLAKRKIKMLTSCDYDKLDTADKVKHGCYLSVYGLTGSITKDKELKKLEKRIGNTGKMLSLADTLDAFK